MKDVIITLEEKFIERSPHIFGGLKIRDATEAKEIWEQMKNRKTTLSEKIKINSQSSLVGANEICINLPKTYRNYY